MRRSSASGWMFDSAAGQTTRGGRVPILGQMEATLGAPDGRPGVAGVPRLSRRSQLFDVAIGLVLGLMAGSSGLSASAAEYPNPGPVTGALMGGAGLVLVLRRRMPLVSFVACLGLMGLSAALYGSYQAGTSLIIGLVSCYTALAYGVPVRLFVIVVTLFAAAEGGRGWPDWLWGFLFVMIVLGLAGAGGWLVHRLRELTAANIALRELVQLEADASTRAAVENERARVARELHDILSHSLGVVVLQTSAAEHAWDADPGRAREALTAARQTATEAVDQLRTLLGVVRDDPGEGRSPVPSLEDLSTLVGRTEAAGFHVALEVTGTPRPVPAAIQASIFRVAQEGIANSLKHSGARGCRIHLAYLTDQVVVQVEDDGRATAPGAGSQLGLVGIRERAALFGGHVQAGPATADGAGWRLQVAFPS